MRTRLSRYLALFVTALVVGCDTPASEAPATPKPDAQAAPAAPAPARGGKPGARPDIPSGQPSTAPLKD